MARIAMPFLVVNMGGEMLYILQQRLQAQNLPADKVSQVLAGVIQPMVSPRFVQELFTPSDMCSPVQLRRIFHALVKSLLDNASMDKMLVFMEMTFKFQLMSVSDPRDLLQVTLNHIAELSAMLPGSSPSTPASSPASVSPDPTKDNVAALEVRFARLFEDMSNADCAELRMALLRVLQDKKVKIAVLEKQQDPSGSIRYKEECTLPIGSNLMPGTVRFYGHDGGSPASTISAATGVSAGGSGSGQSSPALPGGGTGSPNGTARVLFTYQQKFMDRKESKPTVLGLSMYTSPAEQAKKAATIAERGKVIARASLLDELGNNKSAPPATGSPLSSPMIQTSSLSASKDDLSALDELTALAANASFSNLDSDLASLSSLPLPTAGSLDDLSALAELDDLANMLPSELPDLDASLSLGPPMATGTFSKGSSAANLVNPSPLKECTTHFASSPSILQPKSSKLQEDLATGPAPSIRITDGDDLLALLEKASFM